LNKSLMGPTFYNWTHHCALSNIEKYFYKPVWVWDRWIIGPC